MLLHHEREVVSLEPHQAQANAPLQLLLPYVDVICFPCSSRQCLALLVRQFACRRSDLWTQDKPQPARGLLVILTSDKLSEKEVRRVLKSSSDSWLFQPSALTVTRSHAFDGGGDRGGDEDGHTVLKLARKPLQVIRSRKSGLRLLFSAHHLMALVDASLQEDQPAPGYVQLSRAARPVASNLSQHLRNFVGLLDRGQGLRGFATDTIAASLFLDHYTPGMHGRAPNSPRISSRR